MKIRRKKSERAIDASGMRTGVVWYRDEHAWRAMKRIASDPESLEGSYLAWMEMVEEQIKIILEAGIQPVKIPLDADEFAQWCMQENRNPNGAARAAFAVTQLARTDNERGQTPQASENA